MKDTAPGGRNPHGIHGGERYIIIPTELYREAKDIAEAFDMSMEDFLKDAVERRLRELEWEADRNGGN